MSGWKRGKVPEMVRLGSPHLVCWQKKVHDGHLTVLCGPEPSGFHMSISHRTNDQPPKPGRYPTWEEIVDARYRYCPLDVVMAQLLPPQDEWVNVHSTTFHLWEMPKEESSE